MSKKIKRTIALLLVLSAFSATGIYENFKFTSIPAYASTSFDSDYALLDSLKTDEGSLSFSSKRSSVTGKVKSSVDEVEIKATAKDSSYEITIDDDTSDTGSCRATIDLKKNSNNKFKIKVKDPSGDKSTATYYVNIKRGSSSSSSSSSSHSGDDLYLDKLTLSEGHIDFSEDDYDYDVYLDESISSITIKAEPEDEDYTVTINGDVVDDDYNYKAKVNLIKGTNYIPIKLKDDDGDYSTYNLYVHRGSDSDSDVKVGKVDNKQDDIYLDNLIIEDYSRGLNFKKKVTYYEVNLDNTWDSVILKTEPEDDDYTVQINGDRAYESSNYRKRVYLNEGRNEIEIKVDDREEGDSYKDYDKRTYTLVINREASNSDANSNSSEEIDDDKNLQEDTSADNNKDIEENNESDNSEAANNEKNNNTNISTQKINQWIKNEYGQWMYNDSLGNPIKNQWILDKNTNKWYKLNEQGVMCTGFQYENNKTYYLNEDGSMQIGWKNIGGNWYYFKNDGNMVSNQWFQDSNGKWYYFYAGGVMAANIRVGNYIIGADGAMQ